MTQPGIEPGRTPRSGVWPAAATWIAKVVATRGVFLWPIVAALGLWLVGSLVYGSVEREVERLVERHLRSLLDAKSGAVDFWYDRRLQAVSALGTSEAVQAAAAALGPEVDEAVRVAALRELRETLGPYVQAQGLQDALIVTPQLRVASAVDDRLNGALLEDDEAVAAVRRALESGAPAPSAPHRTQLAFADGGRRRTGLPVILLAAPVTDDDGAPLGAVLTVHKLRVLDSLLQRTRNGGGPGRTYALDARATLATGDRFDEPMRALGLIADEPEASAALTLEARDPGVDLTLGRRPAQRRAELPLTRAAAGLVEGKDGVDLAGYRDLRGVKVVGAWTWLADKRIGLVTEVDVADAYAPVAILRDVLTGLLALLGLSAVLIFAFTLLVRRTVRRAGQYTILEQLGQGAMGTVYRARHALLRRPTAVKVLELRHLSRDGLQRFEREAQTTSRLCHPNTITVYDYGRTADGGFYYAMELLEGVTLEDLVARNGPLPPARVVHVLLQVSGALAEAHLAGLIHRDVKPANIMLTNRGGTFDFVKVLDFGLVTRGADDAKVTKTNQLMGTPLYMAPEALDSFERLDARADVHAVGAVGYFLVTGRPPYPGETVPEVIGRILRGALERPSARLGRSVPPALEELLVRCLSRRAADRPADGQALLIELERVRAEVGAWTQAEARAWWAERSPDGGPPPASPSAPTVVLPRTDAVLAPPPPAQPADPPAPPSDSRTVTATSVLPRPAAADEAG
ncbi:MAG: serine/threonine protein kinase [Planctomycetes bacterium]|nr:serine/threonine protein kinase [Planctomycetota bacterium]